MTVLNDLKDFLQRDAELSFLKPKDVERIKWYIDTYFIKKEKDQIELAHMAGQRNAGIDPSAHSALSYYTELNAG